MTKSILELNKLLKDNIVSSEDLVNESIIKSNIIQEKYNAFVTIIDNPETSNPDNKSLLSGIPCGIKDNYSTKGILSTGSSNTLKDYIPFFDATAITKLKENNAIIINKTVMDEFGMGGLGITGHTGIVRNPWNKDRICGGSSAGSACAVAAGVYPYALGSDTGDSIRMPAAYCGIVGYKPTYGMISRYGLFAFASSLDTCGVFTRNVEDAAIVVDAIKGIDEKDMTTWDSSKINLYKSLNNNKDYKVCYIKELCDINNFNNSNEELISHLNNFHKTLEVLKNNNVTVDEVSVDQNILNAVGSAYTVISSAEATSNMSNLNGIVYGPRSKKDNYIDMMKDFRTKGFSPLIKRRFVIGSYVLQAENKDKYFHNAQKLRRLVVDNWKKLYTKYDAVILPAGIGIADEIENIKVINDPKVIALQEHMQIGNFGGFPSITLPNGFINNMPVGINITSNRYEDIKMLNIAKLLEDNLPYKNQVAKEVN